MRKVKLNDKIMSNRDAMAYLGCSIESFKAMKRSGRLVAVSFGPTRKYSGYVTRESVERVLRGEV